MLGVHTSGPQHDLGLQAEHARTAMWCACFCTCEGDSGPLTRVKVHLWRVLLQCDVQFSLQHTRLCLQATYILLRGQRHIRFKCN